MDELAEDVVRLPLMAFKPAGVDVWIGLIDEVGDLLGIVVVSSGADTEIAVMDRLKFCHI